MKTNDVNQTSAWELMLKWNHDCDTHNREGDCILLNEDRTYVEAFANEEEAMRVILNSDELIRNEGFLIPIYYDDGKYRGMMWLSEQDIGNHIDLKMIKG